MLTNTRKTDFVFLREGIGKADTSSDRSILCESTVAGFLQRAAHAWERRYVMAAETCLFSCTQKLYVAHIDGRVLCGVATASCSCHFERRGGKGRSIALIRTLCMIVHTDLHTHLTAIKAWKPCLSVAVRIEVETPYDGRTCSREESRCAAHGG